MHISDPTFAAAAVTMTLADLPECPVSPAQAHAQWAWCARRVFAPAGVPLQFLPQDQAGLRAAPWIWLRLNFAGQEFGLALSEAWAAALVLADGWALEGLDDASLDAWCRVRWAANFPQGLMLLQAGFSAAAAGLDALSSWPWHQAWRGVHVASQEDSGHEVQLWAPADFPAQAAAQLVSGCAQSVLASPLAGLHLDLPLVAARWTADAADVVDLAVGDLLLVG
jgi:hypothetical protein